MKKTLLLVLLSTFALLASAQWEFTNGPYGGYINKITQDSSDNLYALKRNISYQTLYKSSDNGESWNYIANEEINNGMYIETTADGSIILATLDGRLYRSSDEGESWNLLQEFTSSIKDITISGNNLLVLCERSIFYKSSDLGQTWTSSYISNRFLQHIVVIPSGQILCFQSNYNLPGFFFFSDDGLIWDSIQLAIDATINDISTDNSGRLYLSYNSDTDNGIIRSNDGGITWIKIFDGPAISVFFLNNYMIALTSENRYFESYDDGNSWNEKINYYFLTEIIRLRDGNLLSRSLDGIYISQDQGISWEYVSNGLFEIYVQNIAADDSGTVMAITGEGLNNLWKYEESEDSWELISHEIPGQYHYINYSGRYFWLQANDTLYRSTGDGEWNQVSFSPGINSWDVSCADNGNCLFNTNLGLYWSPDFGDSLSLIDVDPEIYQHEGAALYLSKDTAYIIISVHNYKSALLRASYLYRSIDGGKTWSQLSIIINDEYFAWGGQLISDSDGNLYAGNVFYDNKLLGSFDKGVTWTLISSSDNLTGFFADVNNYLYVINGLRNIQRTNNFGESWEDFNDGLPENGYIPYGRSGIGTALGSIYIFIDHARYKGMASHPIKKGVYKRNIINESTNATAIPGNRFSLYPNPVNSSLTIDYPHFNQNGSVFYLIDITGKQLKEIFVNSAKTTIDVTGLKPGFYILRGAGVASKFVITLPIP